MQVAEEARRAAVGANVGEHCRLRRLDVTAFRLDRCSALVEQAEVLAVEREASGVLARQHRIGLRARGDQDRARGQADACVLVPHAVAVVVLRRQRERLRAIVGVDLDGERRQALAEPDALFQRLGDLLVIERVRRAVDEAPAVGDRHAAEALQQLDEAGRAALARRRRALGADRRGVGDELARDGVLRRRPARLDALAPLARAQRLVARQEFLDLHRVVGERFRGGVDRGEAAADDDGRQPQLHVGERIDLGRAGELQRHQEVRRGAHAVGEAVRQLEHRRPAGAERQRDVVEAERERAVAGQRAAEAHAAEQRVARAPRQQHADDLEEILVPAHGDAVLGDAAEARHHALVERLLEHGEVAQRREGAVRQGLSGSGSILRPSIATTVWPSFRR